MKLKLLLNQIIIILLCFSSCTKKEECPTPVCPPPNLNAQTQFTINFCVDESDSSCFTSQELKEVEFVIKDKISDQVIKEETISNLDSMMYQIVIGGDNNKFGPDPTGSSTLEIVQYSYLISLNSTGKNYLIDNFKFDWSDIDPCGCQSTYDFLSVQVNEVEMSVGANTIELKK